jgi:MYXO-CTERM domain-containing protein
MESSSTWRLDGATALIGLAVLAVALIVGIRQDNKGIVDIDQLVYERTLQSMADGDGYYDATVRALAQKDGAPPTQVRSIRPPLLFVGLYSVPENARRPLALVPCAALLLGAAALAGRRAASQRAAVVLTGVWILVSFPTLYLHSELWGAPFLLGAALYVQRDRDAPAAGLLFVATLLRELFALGLLVGLALRPNRRPWALATVAAAVAWLVHAKLASRVVDPAGYDPPLKMEKNPLHYLSPGDTGAAWIVGAILLALGAIGAWQRRNDPHVRYLVAVAAPLLVLTPLVGRQYWTLTWCIPWAVLAATPIVAAIDRVRGSRDPALAS